MVRPGLRSQLHGRCELMLSEPIPVRPDWLRYSTLGFPAYRFVPGLNPHPRNHPEGHSFGKVEERPGTWEAGAWRVLTPYLYGIDLYNYCYWWECHEVLEGLWISAGRHTPHAQFVQGVIQVAAANLHWHKGNRLSARSQAKKGMERIESAAGTAETYMGIGIETFVTDVRAYFDEKLTTPILITLHV